MPINTNIKHQNCIDKKEEERRHTTLHTGGRSKNDSQKIQIWEKKKKKSREEEKLVHLSCSSNISSIWQKEIIHQRKKNIKKYLYPGEGEKIHGKNKNVYLYCVLEQFIHLLENMHSLEKKKHKKLLRSGRRRKDPREEQKFLPLLCSSTRSSIWQKAFIHQRKIT